MERALAALFDLYESLDRCGPGSDAVTRQALAACEGLPAQARIVDFGSGPGPSTLTLAHAGHQVTAIDRHAPFLDRVRERAAQAGLGDRITAQVGDMAQPDFPDQAFDLVWSEGAAYSVGVPTALRAWRRLVAPGGWLAFSELCWRTTKPSPEAAAFWADEYPAMGDAAQVEAHCEAAGWAVAGGFWLPDDAWAAYYEPQTAALPAVRARHPHPEAQSALDQVDRELAVFRAHLGEFGYRFTVARRAS